MSPAAGPDPRPGGLPRARREPRTSTPAPPCPAAPSTCTAPCSTRARRDRSTPGWARRPRSGRSRSSPPTHHDHPHRRGARDRRRAHGVPDDAGHRGAGRDEHPPPRPPGHVRGRERHPQPAQRRDRCGAPWCATPWCGRSTWTRRSSSTPTDTDVLFAQHHWPILGRGAHRRLPGRASATCYRYLHDQTLRLMNQGYTGVEIAEMLELPPELADDVVVPRLLRQRQPQREGHLPALPGLVRRPSGQPVAAAARASAPPLRGGHGRGRRRGGRGPRRRRGG